MSFIPGESVPVESLGISSDAAIWMGVAASEALQAEAAGAGLSLGPSADMITTSPGAVCTRAALKAFVHATRDVSGDVCGKLGGPLVTWSEQPCFGPPARLYRLRGGGTPDEQRLANCTQIEFEVASRPFSFASADAPGGRHLEIVLSDGVLVSTHHWSGLLWANLLNLGPGIWQALIGSPLNVLWKLPLAWVQKRSLDPMVLAGAMNRIGKGVRIHPSAVVEGCWLKDGVQVGPGAVVRGCILGEGARVEDQALANFSVLGSGAVVQRRGWIQYGLLHEGAAVGGAMQMGVLGPHASFKAGSYLMDQNIDNDVHVSRAGELMPVPLGLAGVGVGARTLVASGVWVAPGRSLGPDLVILPPSGNVLHRVQSEPKGVYQVDDGRLQSQ